MPRRRSSNHQGHKKMRTCRSLPNNSAGWPCRGLMPALVLATCLVAGTPLQAAPQAAEGTAGEKITINVQEADIRVLIQWMARHLKKSVIIDPRVKGTVTVHAGDPMPLQDAYQVFLSVLQVHGFAAVESGDTIKIIPDVNAKQQEIPVSRGSGDEMVVRVVRVKNVSAVQLVALLRPLIPQVGHLAAYPSTNVLVISDRAANINRIVEIVAQIDKAGEVDIEMVPVRNADAQQVVDTLSGMLPRTPGTEGGTAVSFAADNRSNSILMSGDPLTREQIKNLIRQLDAPLSADGNTQVHYLHYARAEEIVPVLQSISGSIVKDEKGVSGKGDVSIEASEATNAVVINAPPSMQKTLHRVIKQLDIRRAQVLVEAVIVEVGQDDTDAFGVEWATSDSVLTSNGVIAGSDGGSTFPTGSGINVGPPASFTFGGGFSIGYIKNGNLRSMIRAIETDSDINLLSTPSIVTLDNEEAEILVGQNVPVLTGQTAAGDGSNLVNPFQTIERQDVGIILRIRPHINRGDAITLDVEQEVSSVDQTATGTANQGITTRKRSISTRVLIEDDQILVLGGLIQDNVSENETKVPFLGDLPLVGGLFRSTSIDTDRTNLMVFIHPVILKDQLQSNEITADRYLSIREKQDEYNNSLDSFFDLDGPAPKLEALDPNMPGYPQQHPGATRLPPAQHTGEIVVEERSEADAD